MDIETFVRIADRQRRFLVEASDIDGHYQEVPQERWKPRGNRRGWTRRDIRALAYFFASMEELPRIGGVQVPRPSILDGRYPYCRVSTALRIFDFESPIQDAAQRALAECARHAELAEVSPLVIRFAATHTEWVAWMKNQDPSDVYYRWEADRGELWRLLSMRGLLTEDERKRQWDRWRGLCTTAKRRELLDVFWLAKSPLSKSQIDPDAGTGLRRVIGILNEIAAKQRPPIPWMIRSDENRKWAKHWFGG